MISLKILISLSFLFLIACSPDTTNPFSSNTIHATTILEPKSGSTVTGYVRFSQENKNVILRGSFQGLQPNSEHGFHIHQIGNCSAPDASSAGPHFNPSEVEHGSIDSEVHHKGDMPNIKADAQGRANYQIVLKEANLNSDKLGLLGKSIVLHQDSDDYHTQPAGNSGKRIACGVIK